MVLAVLSLVSCDRAAAIPSRTVVRLTGNSILSEPLAREYERVLPGLHVEVVSEGNFETIRRGAADFGFTHADSAYIDYTTHRDGEGTIFRELRGMAVLQVAPLHLLVREGSGIRDITDLRRRRGRMGMSGPSLRVLAEMVLRAFGIASDVILSEPLSLSDATRWFDDGRLDALFGIPFQLPSAGLLDLTQRGARLLAIEGPAIDQLRHEYPFIRPVSIPSDTYPFQRRAIHSVGIDGLLVCRGDLDERLVYDLTKNLFAALRRLSPHFPGLHLMDVERAPATPIPLHEGAARYYRETELFR